MQEALKNVLMYFMGSHDPYGPGHAERVSRMTVDLACRCGIEMDSNEMIDIELGCILHDVGKIDIPESIRRLPGRYTDVERLIMQQHVVIGESLLRKAANGSISDAVYKMIRNHHENWDGSGYPDGLKGEEIHLYARMLRICDSYDAITNMRGYVHAKNTLEALKMLRADQRRTKIYDPQVFAIFLDMMEEREAV